MRYTAACTIGVAFLCAFQVAPAQAQRVFIAAQGSNGNPCTFAQPCRTFQRAHDVVAAGGEIDVLDPAGYGPLIITKSISIQGHGFSGVSAPGGATAVTINAGANDAVNLRGLLLDGVGTGSMGITFNSGASLHVQDSVVRGFANHGINFAPYVQSTLTVSDTVASDNGVYGIAMRPTSNAGITYVGTFTRVQADNNGSSGFAVVGDLVSNQQLRGVNAIAIDCTATGRNYAQTSNGFLVTSSAGIATFHLFRSIAVANYIGAYAVSTNGGVAAMRLSQSNMDINRIPTGASGTGAVLDTYGNNSTGGHDITPGTAYPLK